MSRPPRIAVIGGGITGHAAAFGLSEALQEQRVEHVALFERVASVGGRALSSHFAGVDNVDCGADAFLARVPDALRLAVDVGLGDDLVHPEPVGAAVWVDGLHPIPGGLVLGVPGNPLALARSSLLSWRGKARAAIEPFLPRSATDHDSIGRLVRDRFGNEVHERLVDALVGSIYATDTDRFSLAELPQLGTLAQHRSLLLGARKVAASATGTATSTISVIFAAPRAGMQSLVEATAHTNTQRGVVSHLGTNTHVETDGVGWRVNDDLFDAVVVATPAAAAHQLLTEVAPDSSALLANAETADVALVSLHVDDDDLPESTRGLSGYLVPKPVQRDVTAVSFGSQKWAHWQPPSGGQILRVSLGRDGAPVLHLDDDEILTRTLADLQHHLGGEITPREVRISRWAGAFAQYRPHHRAWVDAVRAALPAGLHVAGSAYDGIGIPACIRSGKTIAEQAVVSASSLP